MMHDRVAKHVSMSRRAWLRTLSSNLPAFTGIFAPAQAWAAVLEEQSLRKRCIAALAIAVASFALAFYIYKASNVYFSSIIIIAVILTSLYGGLYLGSVSAVVLSLAADYALIPPIGTVFDSPAGYEHFFIVTGLAMFAAFVGSSLRTAVHQTMSAKREAEQASALMERVLALVAHDIRSPLSGIQMGCEFIVTHPDQTGRHQSILAMMLRSVQRVDSMIGSLLDVASMRAGKTIPLSFRDGDLAAGVDHAIDDMSLAGCDRLIFSTRKEIHGYWALSEIHRALENLVTNAAKYGAPDTPITIALRRQGGDALLSVHNHGPAISAADRSTLFEPFRQAERTKARNGWGIGLSLVKGVAEAHGGDVLVESDAKAGTTFTLRLPIRMEPVTAGAARARAPA